CFRHCSIPSSTTPRKKFTSIARRRANWKPDATISFTVGRAIVWRVYVSLNKNGFRRSSKSRRGIGKVRRQKEKGRMEDRHGGLAFRSNRKDFWRNTISPRLWWCYRRKRPSHSARKIFRRKNFFICRAVSMSIDFNQEHGPRNFARCSPVR